MRYFNFLCLLLPLFFYSFIVKKEPTDLKEYGFKGKVKSVSITRYETLVKNSEPLKETEENILHKRTMFFNRQGNIYKMVTAYHKDDLLHKATINFTFKNNRKDKFESFDTEGNVFEKGSYNWHNNYNYSIKTKNVNGAITREYYKLNNKFRDIGGSYKYIIDGNLISEEEYENTLDKKGNIIKSTTTDITYKTEKISEAKHFNKDKNGNSTRIEIFEGKSKELTRVDKRNFEYY